MPQKQDNGEPGKAGPAGRRPHRTAQSPDVSWPARRVGPQPETGERRPGRPETAPDENHIADASDAGGGGQDLRAEMSVDPPQPSPRDYSGGGEPTAPKHGDSRIVPETSPQGHQETSDDGTGGDVWNRVLGNSTNAGMLRLLGAIGLFILVSGTVFWLVT
ncbi:hypothetical protein [Sinorhizobium fredii]|uniref:Transmembrane protein n=1 Tax=Sinorhizobium fredii (strain HH103) TaxID=1117943 RepID=G9AHG8_SINF1|nr:hypothetical protein [Sinorhizobium fredii]CCF00500.1 Hypothetical protein SFHH103_06040 [Sinorhizobium fredii HH103]